MAPYSSSNVKGAHAPASPSSSRSCTTKIDPPARADEGDSEGRLLGDGDGNAQPLVRETRGRRVKGCPCTVLMTGGNTGDKGRSVTWMLASPRHAPSQAIFRSSSTVTVHTIPPATRNRPSRPTSDQRTAAYSTSSAGCQASPAPYGPHLVVWGGSVSDGSVDINWTVTRMGMVDVPQPAYVLGLVLGDEFETAPVGIALLDTAGVMGPGACGGLISPGDCVPCWDPPVAGEADGEYGAGRCGVSAELPDGQETSVMNRIETYSAADDWARDFWSNH
ncbi:hypothetical protein JB92DRAFT_2836306 [Gautieria morchelliformis]|nr:hypothetical protein JB92DRAFT_2836306 [Gautieria morchelliformis]